MSLKSQKKSLLIIALIAGFVFIACPLYAQVPPPTKVESATRESDRLTDSSAYEKKLQRVPKKTGEVKPEEPVPVENEEKFSVEKIKLLGCESFSADEFTSIISKYEKKEVTLTELNTLAKEIEREYLRRGVIAAVFVPPQDINEKEVTLQVVEAKMGELKVQEAPWFKKARLYYYWKSPMGETLRYDKISKSIQLMNKNPDREIKAALTAGKKAGTTDVVLTPKTNFPIHVTSSYDNEGSTSTGKARYSLGLRHNNFLGLDDTLITGYSYGAHFWGRYAYHSLPISPNGTSITYGYSMSKSIPKKEYAAFGIVSAATDVSFSVHQDLFKKDEYIGEVYTGFDANDKTTEMNTGTYSRDRLRMFNAGGTYIHRGFGSSFSISPEVTQGLNVFGASGSNNPLASRSASSVFTKGQLNMNYKTMLPLGLQGNVRVKTQIANAKLTPQQEFSLGGIDSVRGYPSGDYLADNAATGSVELLIPSLMIPKSWKLPYDAAPLRDETTLVTFIDYGWGDRRAALPSEQKKVEFIGVGAGVRFNLYNQFLVRLEMGFPVGYATITEKADSQFHLMIDFQEKLPEEIERIRKEREEKSAKQLAEYFVDSELAKENSPVRQRVNNYMQLAKNAYEHGKLEESKDLYDRVAQIGKSLYQQAEDYFMNSLIREEKLREMKKLADEKYKEGKLGEAKKIWQKIAEEAKAQSLVFEF